MDIHHRGLPVEFGGGPSATSERVRVTKGGASRPRILLTTRVHRDAWKVRSTKLGGPRFHACPGALLQERHDLLLDDVLEVRRPSVGLEGVLARVPLVEQERPGILDLLVDQEFEASRLGTAGLSVLPRSRATVDSCPSVTTYRAMTINMIPSELRVVTSGAEPRRRGPLMGRLAYRRYDAIGSGRMLTRQVVAPIARGFDLGTSALWEAEGGSVARGATMRVGRIVGGREDSDRAAEGARRRGEPGLYPTPKKVSVLRSPTCTIPSPYSSCFCAAFAGSLPAYLPSLLPVGSIGSRFAEARKGEN